MREEGPLLIVEDLHKTFLGAGDVTALSGVNFRLQKGEFVSVLGPSGCGKSTLLRIIAGLLPATAGSVGIAGENVTQPHKDVILLFQEYGRSLLPWRTVQQNVEFGLEIRAQSAQERRAVAQENLRLVGLEKFAQHFPWQLSGGMQQRVALARALACRPKVLLMDEPFGSLDARTREELEDELLRFWNELDLSILFVTHDLDEALYLSQRIVLLTRRPGRVREIRTVSLRHPRNQLQTRSEDEFLGLRSSLYGLLRNEHEDSE